MKPGQRYKLGNHKVTVTSIIGNMVFIEGRKTVKQGIPIKEFKRVAKAI
ncbi:hypothetical protein [Paenibacillus senegalensis]|nr:hypothetical protein [Paenibacillus senegalensis]